MVQHHYTGHTILPGADVHSFRIIVDPTIYELPGVDARFAGKLADIKNDWFAADRNSVWFMNRRIDGKILSKAAIFRDFQKGTGSGKDRAVGDAPRGTLLVEEMSELLLRSWGSSACFCEEV
jgi:hypothetical protein